MSKLLIRNILLRKGQFGFAGMMEMEYRFNDVLEIKNGKNQKQVENTEGQYPIYGSGGVMGYADNYICDSDTVIIGRKGNINNPIYVSEPFWNVDTAFGLSARREILLPRYLYYFCKKFDFEKLNKTVTIPSLTKSDLLKIKIELPVIEEQQLVIDKLTKIESIIGLRKKELIALDGFIKARFVEMFGDENNSKKWEVVDVEDVAEVQVGVVIKPSQYYTDESNGVRAFRSLNVGAGFIKDTDWVYFTQEGHHKNSKSILRENDLLIVRSGAPGTACVVTKKYAEYNAIDIIIAHPDCKRVNPYYLCTFTNMPHGKKQIDEGTGGAARQHFNVGKYSKLKLMLPPKELQDDFADFIEQVDKSKVVWRAQ